MKKINQKQVNREILLDQGVALLMQQGYHGTGLNEILSAVQIPKGSFYSYFGSKENFTAEIIEHYILPYLEQIKTYLKQSEGNALGALERYLQESIIELEKTNFKTTGLAEIKMPVIKNFKIQKDVEQSWSRRGIVLYLESSTDTENRYLVIV